MPKIHNIKTLEREITRLKKRLKEQEFAINNRFENLLSNLEPSKVFTQGVQSLFSSSVKTKSLFSTGLSIGVGLLIEKVLLRKSNFIVKYGLSHLIMNLISNLAQTGVSSELLDQLKKSLQTIKDQHDPSEPEKTNSTDQG